LISLLKMLEDHCKHHKMLEVANFRLAVGPDSTERNSTEFVLTQPMIWAIISSEKASGQAQVLAR
jgi:hypothetical protein